MPRFAPSELYSICYTLSMKRFFVTLAWVLIAVFVTALIIYDMLFLGWIPL